MTALQAFVDTFDCRDRSIADLERALSSDRHGKIRAIIAASHTIEVAQAVVDRCWHDAVVVAAEAEQPLARAA